MHALTSLPRFRLGILAAIAALFLAPSFLRADETPAGELAFTVTAPVGKLSTKQVHDTVIYAVNNRGWDVKEDNIEKVVIQLIKHGHEANMTFLISDKSVEAYFEGYKVKKDGQRTGPEKAKDNSWVGNLKKDITSGLNTAH